MKAPKVETDIQRLATLHRYGSGGGIYFAQSILNCSTVFHLILIIHYALEF